MLTWQATCLFPEYTPPSLKTLLRSFGLIYSPLFYGYLNIVIQASHSRHQQTDLHRLITSRPLIRWLHGLPALIIFSGDLLRLVSINLLVMLIITSLFVYLLLSWHLVLSTQIHKDRRRNQFNKQLLAS